MALSPEKADPPVYPAWVGPVKFVLLALAVVFLYVLVHRWCNTVSFPAVI